MRRKSASLRLVFIQPEEVFQHQAPLLGRQSAQLVPRGITKLGTRSGRARKERARDVDAIAGRGAAGALLLIVWLLAGETAAGVDQFAIELLLPIEGAPVQPSRFELARQLAGFLGQSAGRAPPG